MADYVMKDKIKGHLFNLIIYTHEKRREEYFHQMVHTLIDKFPCRVIFISADKDANEDLLELSDASNDHEQFNIKCSFNHLSHVHSVLLPHLVADLPIYLIWGQDPTADSELLTSLEKLADRLTFDAETTTDLQEFCKKMLYKVDALNIEFMDISWAEMSSWRDVIAQAFHSQKKLEYLYNNQTIRIKYNKLNDPFIKHDAIQAIYLQGWLAAQLNWKSPSLSESNEGINIQYDNHGTPLTLSLLPQERKTLQPGQIFEVSFNDNKLKTTLTFAEQQSKVIVSRYSEDHCQVNYSLPLVALEKGMTAMKEMFYYRPSTHYNHMLKAVSEIPWKTF